MSLPANNAPRRSRQIRLGAVWPHHYRICGGSGIPGCLWVNWAGRSHVFWPNEFLDWPGVAAAAAYRLRRARLRLRRLEVRHAFPGAEWKHLWAEVTLL